MCLAVPAQLTTVSPDGMTAAAMIGGIEKDVDVSLIDDPKSGDWVIVHVGFALNRIDEAEAQETLKALAALAALLPLRHRTTPPPRVLTLRR
ncbi:HypC/HybG/HupF family hydrogenase formation chaperone [Sutterella wadsworthensis]|uniref:HypC/HybG/HupF family hydrogenase formation chaperone n=1 Tax=Sutterella wadsworthensis TaxID=40545 RepID=UPI001F0EA337|nr:HypC/HybG/HupF family hydrogenase formation chaperone [Sutterella wadsworthensis]